MRPWPRSGSCRSAYKPSDPPERPADCGFCLRPSASCLPFLVRPVDRLVSTPPMPR